MADQIKKKLSLRDVLEANNGSTMVPGVHALKDPLQRQTAQLNYGANNYIVENPKETNLQKLARQVTAAKPAVQQTQQAVKPSAGTGTGGGGTMTAAPAAQGQTLQEALLALKNAQSALEKAEGARPGEYTQSAAVQDAYNKLSALEGTRPQGYTPSQAVNDAQNALNALQKPDEYQSRYDAQINGILDTIANAGEFAYQAAEDPMYRMYRDQYLRLGQRAAEDAMANAGALTGGYGSSYGQMAAQQANQNYIAELNNQMPALMQLAYQRHQDNIANQYNQLNAFQSAESMDYGKYRDTVGDYQTERDYLANRYDTEYSKDYGEYRDLVSDYESELMYMYGKYSDMSAEDYQKYMNNMDLWLQDRNYYLQKHGLMQDQANYMQEWEYQTQKKAGGGGGGSSGSSGSSRGNQATYTPTYRNPWWPSEEEEMAAAPGQTVPGVHVLKDQTQAAQNYGQPNVLLDDGTVVTLKDLAKKRQQTEAELLKKYGGYYVNY